MEDIWAVVKYLVRCDEGARRLSGQFKDWTDESNRLFLSIAHGLPHLQREIEVGKLALRDMLGKISDNEAYRGPDSPRTHIIHTFSEMLGNHRQEQHILSEFAAYFDVVRDVQATLGNLGDLMEDVECFSVNAIVQAHNAGDRGRGFSQVSREVVSLTKRAFLEFERVRALAQGIETGVEALRQGIQASHEHFAGIPIADDAGVKLLFTDLDASRAMIIEQVESLIQGVTDSAKQVDRILIGLQFDDRCAQTAQHMTQALARMHQHVGELTDHDQKFFNAAAGQHDLLDTLSYAHGIFSMVDRQVEMLEEELTRIRVEMAAFLDSLAGELQHRGENGVAIEELMETIRKTRENLETFVCGMREIVSAKAEIVNQAERLAGQIYELREALEGIRRTAKRFGVMASLIKVELASAGLTEEFGNALSADRVESLYRDMASSVGTILIALDSTAKQVQRRCTVFRQGMVRESDLLRQAEAYAKRFVKDLDNNLLLYLTRGGSSFKNTLLKLYRETTSLRLEVNSIIALDRQSRRIKADARNRVFRLHETKLGLLQVLGLREWEIRPGRVRDLIDACTIQSERELVHSIFGGEAVESGSAAGELTLF